VGGGEGEIPSFSHIGLLSLVIFYVAPRKNLLKKRCVTVCSVAGPVDGENPQRTSEAKRGPGTAKKNVCARLHETDNWDQPHTRTIETPQPLLRGWKEGEVGVWPKKSGKGGRRHFKEGALAGHRETARGCSIENGVLINHTAGGGRLKFGTGSGKLCWP